MKAGQASRTAVLVCMGRAIAHARAAVPGFADPTALALLPDDDRAIVEHILSEERPKGLRESIRRPYYSRLAEFMALRTAVIDDAVREAAAPQVVVLGAGLDGRAWRMEELRDTVVFEVDHPDTQHEKRARAASLARCAREVRFVPVDFAREDLELALAQAGHDPALSTTWIWEGVIMYLTRGAIEATLGAIGRRSAEGSRLIVTYHRPAPRLWFNRLFVRFLGEPQRSSFEPEAMRALLATHGYAVVRDEDAAAAGARCGPDTAKAMRYMTYFRLAVADRPRRKPTLTETVS